MWQELINNNSFPYSEELNYYLDADSNFYQCSVTPDQFSLAGQCFFGLAEKLDVESERWLKSWQNNSYGQTECVVDYDWDDWLTSRSQQSVKVSFLSKYVMEDNRLTHDYPEGRATRKKEEITTMMPTEENLTSLISIAHQEDIEQWSKIVFDFIFNRNQSVSFNELIKQLNLSPAQIYLGIILSDLFLLLANEEHFYDGFLINLK